MAYQTYTTKALVCGSQNRNTSDRSYRLFTREAGMVFAAARSSRKESSRQRYALQNFSLVRVSLVKGKLGWKIGSIEPNKNYYHLAVDQAARGSVVSTFRLLRRFVGGEENDPELFDYVTDSLDALSQETANRSFVQLVIHVHLLSLLGYVDINKIPNKIKLAHIAQIAEVHSDGTQKVLESLYTQALSVSHL